MNYANANPDQQFLIALGMDMAMLNAKLTIHALDRRKPSYALMELMKHSEAMLQEIDRALNAV